jgi:hypothetical protein
MNKSIGLVATACIVLAAATLPATAAPSQKAPNPRSFAHAVDNPWFPLRAGASFSYRGVKDGKPSRDVVHVTGRTKLIQGVPCTAVSDRLYVDGRLAERTTDWYAQDRAGTVWYFGENTAELDAQGQVTTTEGTWLSGVHGAKPGIYIPGHPHIGQSALQEYYKGHAEDHFKVIGLFRTVVAGRVTNGLLTEEWTPLEPNVLDHKMYVRGIGNVLEQSQKGPNERNELVSVTKK